MLIMEKKKLKNENVFDAAKKFTNAFFDGLKTGATNKAIEAAKRNKAVPTPIIDKMRAIDKLAKELEDDLKYYS
jgi:hypothetical protein